MHTQLASRVKALLTAHELQLLGLLQVLQEAWHWGQLLLTPSS